LPSERHAWPLRGEAQHRALLIEKLQYTIRKLRHDRFGQSSERGTLLDQLELQLADLEEDAAQADAAASLTTASDTIRVPPFERRKPARRPLPEQLPRERIVHPLPATCPCCGGTSLRKIGEDVTETLELIPRVESDPARAREALLPNLRGNHAGPRRLRTRLHVGVRAPSCSPTCYSPSMGCICRSIAKALSMPRKASRRLSRTGSERQPPR